VRSPPVSVRGEVERRIEGQGLVLEARVCAPRGAVRAVVLCHPHPLYGGSMHSPVPLAIAKHLAEVAGDRVAWVRFNFRGVGASGGEYGDGLGEVEDARAVVRFLRREAPGAPLSLCGHSFGAAIALRVAAIEQPVDRLLLIAPSPHLFALLGGAASATEARTTVFVGDRDELCDLAEVRSFAKELGAELRVFQGYDHHFLKSRRALADAALPVIAPEVATP
jgi:alpha/beta superfamily hydrolase